MASTTTFSPDAVHGGPVVATLSGTLDATITESLQRGEVIKFDGSTFSKDNTSTDNIAITAEAVAFTHAQLKHKALVHIPCVIFGRTQVLLSGKNDEDVHGGDMRYIDTDFKIEGSPPDTMTTFKITFVHPKDKIKKNKLQPFEVFVEQYLKDS